MALEVSYKLVVMEGEVSVGEETLYFIGILDFPYRKYNTIIDSTIDSSMFLT